MGTKRRKTGKKGKVKKHSAVTSNNDIEILIVEDSPTQSEQLRYILERHSYNVAVAANGKQALDLMSRRKPTMIISDIVMPEMDGYELCRKIKSTATLRNIPVILLTSLTEPADIIRGLLCAADNFLVKPYDEKYLLSRIDYILINRELRKHETSQLGVEIFFAGQKHSISSDRLQILDLLFSTYETAVQKNTELTKTRDELKKLNEELEERVQQRTTALQKEVEERKRAEVELRKLSRAVEQSPASVIITDREGNIEYVNPKFSEVSGYKPHEVFGKNPRILKSGLTPPEEYRLLWETISAGGEWRGEFHNKKKNGDLFWEAASISPVVNEKGETSHYLAVEEDITDRKRAEEAIKQSEKRYRDLFDANPLPLWVFDLETLKFLAINVAAVKHYGYSRQEFLSMTIKDIRPAEEVHALVKDVKVARSGDESRGIWKHRKKDGSIIDVEITAHNIDFSDRKCRLVLAKDVTEQKLTEKRLKESQAWINAIFEASRDGIVVEENETIVYANRAYAQLLGYNSSEDMIGTHVSIVQSQEDNERMLSYGRMRLQGESAPSHYEFKGKKKGGTSIDLEASVSAARIANKHYIIATVRDISERKAFDAQLRQMGKLESIGTLAGGIAHDFNNILGIIVAYGSLIQRGKISTDDLREYTSIMLKAAERGTALVKQILTFARKSDVSVESVQVNYVIKELVSMLHQMFPKTVGFSLDLEKSLPIIKIDSGQLNQALMNLCVNARDAILEANRAGKKQSTISLRTWKTDGTELRRKFTSAAAEEYVSISVSDTGVGMEESAMHRVFEPFFTTKEQGKGTGLGLAVVYGVVQSHQGIIDLESKLGTGTTFTLYFPVPKDVSGETALKKKELEEASGGSETVLVIEDEEALRVLLKNLLQAKGYTVITASDGLEGIAVFEENKSKIAMVVSDHGLPGLNGADAVKRMIATKRELKCIIASGYIEPNQKSEIFKSGVKEFIQKPYDPIEVVRKVREVLDSK